jgi:hypothetical protein
MDLLFPKLTYFNQIQIYWFEDVLANHYFVNQTAYIPCNCRYFSIIGTNKFGWSATN